MYGCVFAISHKMYIAQLHYVMNQERYKYKFTYVHTCHKFLTIFKNGIVIWKTFPTIFFIGSHFYVRFMEITFFINEHLVISLSA